MSVNSSKEMTPFEITIIYMMFAVFFCFVGFVYADTTSATVEVDYSKLSVPNPVYIFINNIAFFTLICIIPVVNYPLYVMQFIALGNNAYKISNLAVSLQINILYRHAIFEVIALTVSVYVSYKIYYALRKYLRNSKKITKSTIAEVIILYLSIAGLTIIGAILEGSINV